MKRKLLFAEKKIPVFENAASVVKYALLDKKNSEKGIVSMILSKARGKYTEYTLSADRYAEYLTLLQEKRS